MKLSPALSISRAAGESVLSEKTGRNVVTPDFGAVSVNDTAIKSCFVRGVLSLVIAIKVFSLRF